MPLTTEQLKEMGYSIRVDKFGYKVYLNGEFIYGAGTARDRKMHWRHARANVKDYTKRAWSVARDHVRDCEHKKEAK